MIKKTISILFFCLLCGSILLSGCTTTNKQTKTSTLEDTAKNLIYLFVNESFNTAYNTLLNDSVKELTTPDQLQLIWNQITETYGNFTKIISTKTTQEQGYTVVYVTCNYEKLGLLDLRVVFGKNNLIAGFQFVPTDLSDQYQPPSYANPETFKEYNVTVGADTSWPLPGTLTVPDGDGLYPAVVLVQGSGPNDRDETVGPNKPFKDIAWGLATKGIVVLRYEKRTKYYASTIVNMLENFTVYDETIDDAREAVDLLKETEHVDSDHIYVLGHSLGAMLAPRIALNDSNISGIIMLAAPARPLTELLINQTIYLASLDGNISDAEQKQIDELKENVTKIREHNISPGEIILGASAAYWYDIESYDPVATAEMLSIPMLILQGERDYQVSYEYDFSVWQNAFVDNANVTLIAYPTLNHLFIAGSGPPSNVEYNIPGNVDEQVIIDIANWINGV